MSRKKLTALFTCIVFGVVFILGFSMLSAKYYNELRLQKRAFDINSIKIQQFLQKKNTQEFSLFYGQKIPRGQSFDEYIQKSPPLQENFLSFYVLNNEKKVIYEHIMEYVDFGEVTLPKDFKIYSSRYFLYRVLPLSGTENHKILFYERVHYHGKYFLHDLLLLLIMVLVFSYFVYFLGKRFVNRALIPVRENLEDMDAFIHNAGHELKTPLAVMRGNLQVMQAEKNFDEDLLKKSISQIDHMNTLIESLRELSEIGTFFDKTRLNLQEEVHAVLEIFLPLIEKKELNIIKHIDKNFYISANRYGLHVLLSNIIKNAIIYNIQAGEIEIRQDKNIFSLRDTGKGIPKDQQEKVFERFFRGDNVRNSQEGLGIGLSLVKKIIELHNWKIEIQSTQEKGTTITIIF